MSRKPSKSPAFLNLFKSVVINPVLKMNYDLRIKGLENVPERGPVVFICKHWHWMDLFAAALLSPRAMNYIAKYELFENLFGDFPGTLLYKIGRVARPFTDWGLYKLGALPIDREKPSRILSTFKKTYELIENDEFIVIYPEGRTFPGEVAPFKEGLINLLVRMQKKLKKEIKFIPVGISYGKKGKGKIPMVVKIGKVMTFEPKKACDASGMLQKEVERLTDLNRDVAG